MKSDIEIAQSIQLEPIEKIAKKLNISNEALINYGHHIAKVDRSKINLKKRSSKLILVTAVSPTPAGEGKTTTTIGLADALCAAGENALACVREPSLGPVFGLKGGATGGGMSQALPMENINLHFTGDFHAITSANNLLAALIDNHIYHGNDLGIDPNKITFNRCVDMNDRSLRKIDINSDRYQYRNRFNISVASEIMAIFCLASSLEDLEYRLGEIEVAKNIDPSKPSILAKDLKAQGSMVALLKDAFMPNLVQTIAQTPTLIHGGPFANIAHGCNSFVATELGLSLADYVVTEAGFGADLGAEKFIDIKCRATGLNPDIIVLVATIRALKYHGGLEKDELNGENLGALEKGFANLSRHIKNCNEHYGKEVVVALNHFALDTDQEIQFVQDAVKDLGASCFVCRHWADGPKGAMDLANGIIEMLKLADKKPIKYVYDLDASLSEKIETIAKKIYHAKDVKFEPEALKQLEDLSKKYNDFPVCIAKTPYSFSSDPAQRGAASDHTLAVRELRLSRGAGFIVAVCGDLMTMPGLPKIPASEHIYVDKSGFIVGLS
ncbi:MAG: formate--tetrahydrofolate ligase [Methylophilaceae bacterium]